ncbi:MAG: ThiF family adenylyltransferase [Bacteroidia bacterium]|jgi:molybdopterin/thiamine biosynthesis adenylyltransferase|nr:ThiF family adenylyltransferase [Bacteroidia bacterium]
MKLDQQFSLHAYKPIILNYSSNEYKLQLDQLKQQHDIEIIDTIEQQLSEWIRIQHVGKAITSDFIQEQTQLLLNGKSIEAFGNWIYYPWSKRLVHLLPEDAFITVRTNRNQLKITKAEQAVLRNKSIGIIGLSVGQSVAVTLAIERTCGTIKLADFDTLELSNLNRLRAGIHQLGLPKVIIAAREVAEIDPYLNIEIYSEGITPDNLDSFLGEGRHKIDILVEVCDRLDIKIQSRIAARDKRIPVLMDTNDRGMIDIERFDLEPNRPLFHGLIDDKLDFAKLETNERLMVLMKLASFEHSSERLKISMSSIGKSILTWPQLASSVSLGAGAACDTIRRILLNQIQTSGRYYIDLETLIQ